MNERLTTYDSKMTKTINNLDGELATIRAGRANPHVHDKLTVDYYGSPTPIQQVANVSVPEARMIQIQPWEKSMLKEIEKAILMSDLGINPTNDGSTVRLVFPEGQVGDDDAVDATFRTFPAEGFKAEVQDRIEISHQYQRYADIAADVTQLVKEDAERHSVAQGAGGGILNDDAVCHGVAEGDADFQHVYASCGQCADDVSRTSGRRVSGTEIQRKDILFLLVE